MALAPRRSGSLAGTGTSRSSNSSSPRAPRWMRPTRRETARYSPRARAATSRSHAASYRGVRMSQRQTRAGTPPSSSHPLAGTPSSSKSSWTRRGIPTCGTARGSSRWPLSRPSSRPLAPPRRRKRCWRLGPTSPLWMPTARAPSRWRRSAATRRSRAPSWPPRQPPRTRTTWTTKTRRARPLSGSRPAPAARPTSRSSSALGRRKTRQTHWGSRRSQPQRRTGMRRASRCSLLSSPRKQPSYPHSARPENSRAVRIAHPGCRRPNGMRRGSEGRRGMSLCSLHNTPNIPQVTKGVIFDPQQVVGPYSCGLSRSV
mmetsp:Transcript_10493/g.25554  ORF Transcript_10493/g.25554 Transcript_10493/m.25554 type:complete len:315 (+) Transcript_10493:287-1231(+)